MKVVHKALKLAMSLRQEMSGEWFWQWEDGGYASAYFLTAHDACSWALREGYETVPEAAEVDQKLRDELAKLALKELLRSGEWLGMTKLMAEKAYEIADAMLKERDKC